MRLLLLGSAAAFVAHMGAAHAEFVDGNRLKDWLDADMRVEANPDRPSTQDAFDAGRAQGFVLGVWEVGVDVRFCSPGKLTAGQVMAVAKKYLNENPAKLSDSAHVLVDQAFQVSFPCKR